MPYFGRSHWDIKEGYCRHPSLAHSRTSLGRNGTPLRFPRVYEIPQATLFHKVAATAPWISNAASSSSKADDDLSAAGPAICPFTNCAVFPIHHRHDFDASHGHPRQCRRFQCYERADFRACWTWPTRRTCTEPSAKALRGRPGYLPDLWSRVNYFPSLKPGPCPVLLEIFLRTPVPTL